MSHTPVETAVLTEVKLVTPVVPAVPVSWLKTEEGPAATVLDNPRSDRLRTFLKL